MPPVSRGAPGLVLLALRRRACGRASAAATPSQPPPPPCSAAPGSRGRAGAAPRARQPSVAAPPRCVASMSARAEGLHPSAAQSRGVASLAALEEQLGGPLGTAPQAPPRQPLVLVISGPSGVGKDAVVHALQQRRPATHFVVTATSRPQRPGERHGVDYLFVTTEEFKSLIERGELLEHALVYGDYKGIPKAQVRDALAAGTDVVLRLDVQGAATMRRLLPGAVFIFLVAESEAALVTRLVSRKTEPPDKLLLRVATAREETRRLAEFDYCVVNAQGQLERAVDDLCAIIDAEKLKVGRPPLQL